MGKALPYNTFSIFSAVYYSFKFGTHPTVLTIESYLIKPTGPFNCILINQKCLILWRTGIYFPNFHMNNRLVWEDDPIDDIKFCFLFPVLVKQKLIPSTIIK